MYKHIYKYSTKMDSLERFIEGQHMKQGGNTIQGQRQMLNALVSLLTDDNDQNYAQIVMTIKKYLNAFRYGLASIVEEINDQELDDIYNIIVQFLHGSAQISKIMADVQQRAAGKLNCDHKFCRGREVADYKNYNDYKKCRPCPVQCIETPPYVCHYLKSPPPEDWVKYDNHVLTHPSEPTTGFATSFDGTKSGPHGGKTITLDCYGGRCAWDLNSTWPTTYNQLSPWTSNPPAIPGVDNMNTVINPGNADGPKDGNRNTWVDNAKRIPKTIGISTWGPYLNIYGKDANIWGGKLYLKPMKGVTSYVRKGSPIEGRFNP